MSCSAMTGMARQLRYKRVLRGRLCGDAVELLSTGIIVADPRNVQSPNCDIAKPECQDFLLFRQHIY